MMRMAFRRSYILRCASSASAAATSSTSASSTETAKEIPPPPTSPPAPEPLGLYEILPRYPEMSTMGALRALDLIGTCSFAISGSVTAATCGCDLVGCVVIGSITALGGGTIRDLLFGQTPVGWIQETEYVKLAAGFSLLTFICCCTVQPDSFGFYRTVMFWSDTIGLGAFAVLGTMFAIRLGYSLFIILICTVLTCTGGGIVRDTLCRRPARVLHAYAEMYAGTTLFGSAVYLAMRKMSLPLQLRVPAAVLAVVAARCYCVATGFALPTAFAVVRSHSDEVSQLQAVANADVLPVVANAIKEEGGDVDAAKVLQEQQQLAAKRQANEMTRSLNEVPTNDGTVVLPKTAAADTSAPVLDETTVASHQQGADPIPAVVVDVSATKYFLPVVQLGSFWPFSSTDSEAASSSSAIGDALKRVNEAASAPPPTSSSSA